jgi:hypothetical protein
MSEVQAIAFYKKLPGQNSGWTKDKASKWLISHDYNPIKAVHETKNMLHYRINEPIKYKGFISKTVGSNGKQILLTIGLPKRIKEIKGGVAVGPPSEGSSWDVEPSNPIDFQQVFPLRKEEGILEKPIVPTAEFQRALDHDRVSISDVTNRNIVQSEYDSYMGPDTLIGYMLRPKSKGGIGFPFPTSASTFSPMDWFSMSNRS